MEVIERIGTQVERAWRAAQYDATALPEIATAALEELAPHRTFRIEELVRWLHTAPQIPRQSMDASFGEPPVTLFTGRHFVVEALFWLDGTTTIHRHAFSGAFQVLLGSSLHTRFTFTPAQTINRHLLLGELACDPPELLRRGDTRAIRSGDALIHSLFHLDRPSVTLVVRSYHDAGTTPQYSYLSPGIAHDPFRRDERLPRLLQLFDVLCRTQSPDRVRLAREVLETADLHASLQLLLRWLMARPHDRDELDELLAVVAARHPYAATHLPAALAEQRRQHLLVQRRHTVHAADHRFLLALLLNVTHREDLLRLVAARDPGCDPIDRVVGWIGELATPLGLDLGEAELRVLRLLLADRTVDEIVAALAEEYDDVTGQTEAIARLCATLESAPPLRPLFRRRR